MTIEQREELIELYDVYYSLLTEKQKEYFEEYYFDDLSISEIAANHDISRNAVHDQLKRVIANLEDYEQKLQLIKKFKSIENLNLEEQIEEKILDILKGWYLWHLII